MRRPPLPFVAVSSLALLTSGAAPAFADTPPEAVAGATAPAPLPLAPLRTPADETRALRFTAGVSLTAIGGTALVLGAVLGARALVSRNDVGGHCDASGTCDLAGYTYGTQAQDFARTSTIFVGGGLGLAAVGVGLILSAKPWRPGLGPRSTGASVWVAPARAGIAVGARW